MARRERARRLRHGQPGLRRHPPLPRAARGRAPQARADGDAEPGSRSRARAGQGAGAARRRGAVGRARAARGRPPPGVPARGRAPGVDLRGGPVPHRAAGPARPRAEHGPPRLPPPRGRRARAPRAQARGARALAGGAGLDRASLLHARRDRPALRGGAGAGPAGASPDGARRRGVLHPRARAAGRDRVPRRAKPRLRRAGRAVEPGLLRRGARAGRAGDARRVDRALGGDGGTLPRGGAGGRAGAARAAARARSPGGAAGPGRRARARLRRLRGRAHRPRGGRRPLAGRGRAAAHGHRRLPVVHRLGPRLHDQPRGPHALHRPRTHRRLDPEDLLPPLQGRPHPEPLPGGRCGGPLSHRRRHPLDVPRLRALPPGDRGPRPFAPALAMLRGVLRPSPARHALRHRGRREGRAPPPGRRGLPAHLDGREGGRIGW